jgi:hypothetical protein
MKKELLLASALTASFGLAGVAEAASATFSGNHRVGMISSDTNAGADAANTTTQVSSFSVSLSETTDSGIVISSGFDMAEESGAGSGTQDPSGLTLTFTSGAKLDLVEAGSAYASQLAAVPSQSGEQGVGGSTTLSAPEGLDYADSNDTLGFKFHTAADAFGVDGLKASVSASFNGDAPSTGSGASSSAAVGSSFSVGASYVTTAGDTTVTIGGGLMQAEAVGSLVTVDKQSTAIAATAATGNLTLGVGYAMGDDFGNIDAAATAAYLKDVSVTTMGAKYVSGDMTFSIGAKSGSAKDQVQGAAQSTFSDTYNSMGASVDYVVASGVTATIGFTDVAREEGGNDQVENTAHSGSSWYIGANISF